MKPSSKAPSRSPQDDSTSLSATEQLIGLMRMLRDPEHGCRWDIKQTMQSLASHTVEEVYEVVDAVEQGDADKICDELGDLLFQIVFYARIAEEQQCFTFDDVASGVHAKLLHRHPHVFPDGTLASFGQPGERISPGEVESNWESIKNAERERAGKNLPDVTRVSVLDDVPRALPALDRARKLQKRAASVGFDWPDVVPVLARLREEIGELEQAIEAGQAADIEAELGDVLFTCVNLSRHLQVNAETALRGTNQRFEQRFRHVETLAGKQGAVMKRVEPEQLDLWWQAAKKIEKGEKGDP